MLRELLFLLGQCARSDWVLDLSPLHDCAPDGTEPKTWLSKGSGGLPCGVELGLSSLDTQFFGLTLPETGSTDDVYLRFERLKGQDIETAIKGALNSANSHAAGKLEASLQTWPARNKVVELQLQKQDLTQVPKIASLQKTWTDLVQKARDAQIPLAMSTIDSIVEVVSNGEPRNDELAATVHWLKEMASSPQMRSARSNAGNGAGLSFTFNERALASYT